MHGPLMSNSNVKNNPSKILGKTTITILIGLWIYKYTQ
jgi:hypothetical protein